MAIKKAEENKEKNKEATEIVKKVSQEEFEKKVLELAEKGLTSEKIGETLRKQGIHSREYNKKISKILGTNYKGPDLINVNQKLEKVKKHYAKNPQDKRAMREKDRIFSQIRKMKKYLKISN
jgi:ribosomal protein S15P/S13E